MNLVSFTGRRPQESLLSGCSNLVIDTTHLPSDEAARAIVEHFDLHTTEK
jgi:hypothetical protein